jgi:ABC-2 type transport system ATP-binding protein
MDPAISARGLRVVRGGAEVIPGLDLSVPRGQVVGLLGPSGCGKSTLMRAIVGVQIVEAGSIDVLGLPAGRKDLRRRVGYVTQAPSVYSDLTVRQNLRYFATVVGTPRRDLDAEVERVIAAVDLGARADAKVAEMSGGQRSRVSLGAALVGSPELLILDEPTVGLDPVLRRDLWNLFRELAEGGVTLLISSHVMDEASRCDRLLLMREGRLLADDTLAGVLDTTGAPDIERAFLTLIDRAEAAEAADTGRADGAGAAA